MKRVVTLLAIVVALLSAAVVLYSFFLSDGTVCESGKPDIELVIDKAAEGLADEAESSGLQGGPEVGSSMGVLPLDDGTTSIESDDASAGYSELPRDFSEGASQPYAVWSGVSSATPDTDIP